MVTKRINNRIIISFLQSTLPPFSSLTHLIHLSLGIQVDLPPSPPLVILPCLNSLILVICPNHQSIPFYQHCEWFLPNFLTDCLISETCTLIISLLPFIQVSDDKTAINRINIYVLYFELTSTC